FKMTHARQNQFISLSDIFSAARNLNRYSNTSKHILDREQVAGAVVYQGEHGGWFMFNKLYQTL
ncbi:MAG TPA: hypothetical protein PLC62_12855, partial [Chitinophagaceae bacterium]|nr:hypothetical protein [Chitinophagaceae bacterium]